MAACRSKKCDAGCEGKEQAAGELHWAKVFHSGRIAVEIKCDVDIEGGLGGFGGVDSGTGAAKALAGLNPAVMDRERATASYRGAFAPKALPIPLVVP
jgi:hypothetical protein